MIWLIGEIWAWLLVSAASGAGLTALLATKRERTQQWVPRPAQLVADPLDARALLEPDMSVERAKPVPASPPASPFTELTGGARSWEEEEEWSRAVRPAREVDDFPYAQPVEAVWSDTERR